MESRIKIHIATITILCSCNSELDVFIDISEEAGETKNVQCPHCNSKYCITFRSNLHFFIVSSLTPSNTHTLTSIHNFDIPENELLSFMEKQKEN